MFLIWLEVRLMDKFLRMPNPNLLLKLMCDHFLRTWAPWTAKIEIKLSQNVNGKTAVLFSICDKKSTNQRREQKCHIFVTDVIYSKFWLQVVTIFCHIVACIILSLCDNFLPYCSVFNFASLWHFNAKLWQSILATCCDHFLHCSM